MKTEPKTRRWKTADFDRALPMLRLGWNVREIAEKLGVSKTAAGVRLKPYLKRYATAGLP